MTAPTDMTHGTAHSATDRTAAASILLCLLDTAGLTAALSGGPGAAPVLTVHVAAVAILGGVPLLRHGRSIRLEQWCVIALLFGPFGGMVLCLFRATTGRESDRLPASRATPDVPVPSPAEQLAARIRDGRRHRLGKAPAPFTQVFASDDVAAQQHALASISRSYRPEMRDGLRLALESAVPAIRVQAAAVHARLRGQFDARAKALLTDGPAADPQEALEVALSGFVTAEVAARLTNSTARDKPHGLPAGSDPDAPTATVVSLRKKDRLPSLASQTELDAVAG